MSDEKTSASAGLLQRKLVRGLIGLTALLGSAYVVLQFVPVYHIAHERDPTLGVNGLLKEVQALQAAHYAEHGRYLGDVTWSEWPTGPFPSAEGVPWGQPAEGPWSEMSLRPRAPLPFKLRLRAGMRPEQAPEGLLPAPPEGPWYVAQARADVDGDGVIWLIEVSSATYSLYVENEGE